MFSDTSKNNIDSTAGKGFLATQSQKKTNKIIKLSRLERRIMVILFIHLTLLSEGKKINYSTNVCKFVDKAIDKEFTTIFETFYFIVKKSLELHSIF